MAFTEIENARVKEGSSVVANYKFSFQYVKIEVLAGHQTEKFNQ